MQTVGSTFHFFRLEHSLAAKRFKSGRCLQPCLPFARRRNATCVGSNLTGQASLSPTTMARLMPRRFPPTLTPQRTSPTDRNQRRLLINLSLRILVYKRCRRWSQGYRCPSQPPPVGFSAPPVTLFAPVRSLWHYLIVLCILTVLFRLFTTTT